MSFNSLSISFIIKNVVNYKNVTVKCSKNVVLLHKNVVTESENVVIENKKKDSKKYCLNLFPVISYKWYFVTTN